MNNDLQKELPCNKTDAQAATPPGKAEQSRQQPADEEIGDYSDPDAVQVDGGDNSFIADEPKVSDTAKKPSDAG